MSEANSRIIIDNLLRESGCNLPENNGIMQNYLNRLISFYDSFGDQLYQG